MNKEHSTFIVTKYAIADSRIPQVLKDYDLILRKKKLLDHTFTYQPSFFAICDDELVSSCIDEDGKVWVSSANEVRRFDVYESDRGNVERLSGEQYFTGQIRALLAEGEYIWALTDQMVSRIQYKTESVNNGGLDSVQRSQQVHTAGKYGVLDKVAYTPVKLVPGFQKEMKYYSTAEFLETTDVTEADKQAIFQGFAASLKIPEQMEVIHAVGLKQLTCFVKDGDTLWMGTRFGLQRIDMRENDSRDFMQYLAGPRYLYNGDDHVSGLHSDGNHGIWVQNSRGIVHIQFIRKTLKQKADVLEQIIKDVHDRRGMVTDGCQFQVVDGKFRGLNSTRDNDGLWTAEYAIGEIYRYLTAKKENDKEEMAAAKKDAVRAVKAVMLLQQISGRADGFPARSYVVKGEEDNHLDAFWFEKQEAGPDGKRYAVAVNTKHAALNQVEHFLVTDPARVKEAKETYKASTGRDYDADWGETFGTDGVYPVILDKQNMNKVVWQLKSEIREDIDPVLAALYTDSGYKDSDLIYKADTSSDEICGHMPMLYFATRYLFDGTDPEDAHLKQLAIKFADRMMHHIVTRGFILQDEHGNFTTWAKWFAEYFLPESHGADDCSLNATELMSFLKAAIYLTADDPVYKEHHDLYTKVYDDLWNENYDGTEDGKGYVHLLHKYIERKTKYLSQHYDEYQEVNGTISRQDDWTLMINYSDENLFIMSFLPLIELELDDNPDSERVGHLRGLWNQWWGNMKRENNPLYTFIHQYTFANETDADLQSAAWMLQRMPQYRVEFPANNSRRRDYLLLDIANYRDKGVKSVNRPMAPDETYTYKFNSNPFLVYDDIDTKQEGTPYHNVDYNTGSMSAATWFTLPYWMGRYLGMLQGE